MLRKSSISMGHLYHGYVSHNQRVSFFNQWMTSRKIDPRSIVRASIHAGFFAVTCIDNEKHVSFSIGTERNVQGAKKNTVHYSYHFFIICFHDY